MSSWTGQGSAQLRPLSHARRRYSQIFIHVEDESTTISPRLHMIRIHPGRSVAAWPYVAQPMHLDHRMLTEVA